MRKKILGTAIGIFAAVGFVTVTALAVRELMKIKKITARADEDPVDNAEGDTEACAEEAKADTAEEADAEEACTAPYDGTSIFTAMSADEEEAEDESDDEQEEDNRPLRYRRCRKKYIGYLRKNPGEHMDF